MDVEDIEIQLFVRAMQLLAQVYFKDSEAHPLRQGPFHGSVSSEN